MKLITKKTDYAIRSLMYLARNSDRFVPSTEIAHKEAIPKQYLRNILQSLIKAGILSSKEGVAGGVILKTEAKTVFITDIIRIFQGSIELSECFFRKNICPERSRCVLRSRIKVAEEKLIQEFSGISIEMLKNDLEIGD